MPYLELDRCGTSDDKSIITLSIGASNIREIAENN
jgi:hypothetical protein